MRTALQWGAKYKKAYDLDENGQRIKLASGNWKSHKEDTTDWNSQDNAELWRGNWSEHCNIYLEKLGQAERIDHRSYERQGIDKIPSIHLGVAASQMEQKGIATDRGNLNRQILLDNKLMNQTRARISRLMKWQRELEVQPLDLPKAEIKTSVIDRLNTNKTATGGRYQTIRELKNYASVWNFMQKHNIDNLGNFTNKIVDMNESYYTIKREMQSIQKDISKFENHISLCEEYQSFRPFVAQYEKLDGKEKIAAYNKHKDKIERYKTLHSYFVNLKKSGDKLKQKVWGNKISKHKNDIALCEWKMKALKDEIGIAQKIKKTIDEISRYETQSKDKKRVT